MSDDRRIVVAGRRKPRSRRVVSLAERRLEPCADVVDICRTLLSRAESGHVRSICFAAGLDAGGTSTGFAIGDVPLAELNLALDHLKLRLIGGAE